LDVKLKISVVTVSYNSAETITFTIQSIADQGYRDIEYIVVDGASTDATSDIISFSCIVSKFISEPDSGIYDAMNKGVRYASGEVIGVLNSDDFFIHDHVLDEVNELFSTDPELDVVLGDVDFVTNADLNSPVRVYKAEGFKPWMFRFGFMPPHPAVFVRKSAYERVGAYKLGYKIAADFDFLTRLLLIDGAKYKIAGKTWVRMRTGGASTNGIKSNLISTKEMLRSLKENGVYSNLFFLLFRLPVKYVRQIFLK
jgi:glycosyltransferase involved in cell wall biosynthesis